MVHQAEEPSKDFGPDLVRAFEVVLDHVASHVAERVTVLRARQTDARAIRFAAIDADTLRSLADGLPDGPEVAKIRALAARVAQQLQEVVR